MSFVRFRVDTLHINEKKREVTIDAVNLDRAGTHKRFEYHGADVDRLIDQLKAQKRFGICFIFGDMARVECEAVVTGSRTLRLESGDKDGLTVLLPEETVIPFDARVMITGVIGVPDDVLDDAWLLSGKIQSPSPSIDMNAGM